MAGVFTRSLAQGVKNPLAMQETQEMQVQYLGWEDPLEELAAPSSLPEKSHGQRSLVGYSPKGRRVGPDRATEEEGPRIPF